MSACTTLHSRRHTLLICGSASLARSFTHAGRRCSDTAVPALHDPSLMPTDAAHLRQCQPAYSATYVWYCLAKAVITANFMKPSTTYLPVIVNKNRLTLPSRWFHIDNQYYFLVNQCIQVILDGINGILMIWKVGRS